MYVIYGTIILTLVLIPIVLVCRWMLVNEMKNSAFSEWQEMGCPSSNYFSKDFHENIFDIRLLAFIFTFKYRAIGSPRLRLLGDCFLVAYALLCIYSLLFVLGYGAGTTKPHSWRGDLG